MKRGLLLILLILTASLLAPILTSKTALNYNLSERLQGPSVSHFFGTDENGSDVLAKVLYGGRLSLFVAFSVVGISSLIGLVLGTFAGFFGGVAESILMRTIDMLQAFPGFLIALALIAFMGPSLGNVVLALCVTGWTAYARLVKAEVEAIKEREFVKSAFALGIPSRQIIFRHIWPNLFAALSVQMTFGLAGAVISEAGLSFLGLGAPPSTPSWGALLSSGRRYLISAPTLSIFPGLALVVLVLGFNLLGDGLRKR
jgi:peptide/nickel transport system permease protein